MIEKITFSVGSILAIWGLSLIEIDILIKIICTVAITIVSIYIALRKKKK